MEEILELSRTNQKILRSPDILFPPEYFEYIMKERLDRDFSERDKNMLDEQRHITMELRHRMMQTRDLLEIYRNEKKTIDDDFYVTISRMMDMIQRLQMLSEQTYKMYIKRK